MTRNLRQLPLLLLTFCLPWSLHVQAERDVFSSQNAFLQKELAGAKVIRVIHIGVTSSDTLPDQYGKRGPRWIAQTFRRLDR